MAGPQSVFAPVSLPKGEGYEPDEIVTSAGERPAWRAAIIDLGTHDRTFTNDEIVTEADGRTPVLGPDGKPLKTGQKVLVVRPQRRLYMVWELVDPDERKRDGSNFFIGTDFALSFRP